MTDAPERIYLLPSLPWAVSLNPGGIEYTRADLSSPLGAVAIRDACKDKLISGTTLLRNCGMGDIADLLTDHAADFDTLPLPDHAALLTHAMKLPEVAAMVEALHFYADFYENPNEGPWGVNSEDFGKVARTALKAKP